MIKVASRAICTRQNKQITIIGRITAVYQHVMPNKRISVFQVTGLNILDRVGTHILFFFIIL